MLDNLIKSARQTINPQTWAGSGYTPSKKSTAKLADVLKKTLGDTALGPLTPVMQAISRQIASLPAPSGGTVGKKIGQALPNFPDWVGKNFVLPESQRPEELKQPLTDIGTALGAFGSPLVNAEASYLQDKPANEHLGDVAGGVGWATHPFATMAGGPLGMIFNAAANKLGGKPAAKGAKTAAIEGINYSAKLSALSDLATPLLKPIISKLSPEQVDNAYKLVHESVTSGVSKSKVAELLYKNILASGITGGVPMAALETLKPAKDIKQMAANMTRGFATGFSFGSAGKALGYGTQLGIGALKNAGLQPGFISLGGNTGPMYKDPLATNDAWSSGPDIANPPPKSSWKANPDISNISSTNPVDDGSLLSKLKTAQDSGDMSRIKAVTDMIRASNVNSGDLQGGNQTIDGKQMLADLDKAMNPKSFDPTRAKEIIGQLFHNPDFKDYQSGLSYYLSLLNNTK